VKCKSVQTSFHAWKTVLFPKRPQTNTCTEYEWWYYIHYYQLLYYNYFRSNIHLQKGLQRCNLITMLYSIFDFHSLHPRPFPSSPPLERKILRIVKGQSHLVWKNSFYFCLSIHLLYTFNRLLYSILIVLLILRLGSSTKLNMYMYTIVINWDCLCY